MISGVPISAVAISGKQAPASVKVDDIACVPGRCVQVPLPTAGCNIELAGLCWFPKDPQAYLDYSLDWSAWLTSPEVIVESTWSYLPDTINPSQVVYSDTQTGFWAAGGVDGETYVFTNRIVTDAGRITERSVLLKVQHL